MAAPFISSGRTDSEPSRAPSDSKIGTDFWKSSLCNYTKFQFASINRKKVVRGGAGPTQSEPTFYFVMPWYMYMYIVV